MYSEDSSPEKYRQRLAELKNRDRLSVEAKSGLERGHMTTYTCRMCGKTTHSAGITHSCAYCGGSTDSEQKPDEQKAEKELPFLQQLKRRITEAYRL